MNFHHEYAKTKTTCNNCFCYSDRIGIYCGRCGMAKYRFPNIGKRHYLAPEEVVNSINNHLSNICKSRYFSLKLSDLLGNIL